MTKNIDIIYVLMNGTLNLILNKIENIHSFYLICIMIPNIYILKVN